MLWADRNIGANAPEDAGLYFQWGDTQGYTAEQIGEGEGLKAFSWADYKFSIDGSTFNFSKYNRTDRKTVLDPEDDAAHVIMGGNWRMPTFEEYKELCLNTDIYLVPTTGAEIQGTAQEDGGGININWTSRPQGTLKGVKFYKKGDKQTYMLFPASGSISSSLVNVGINGDLWASSQYSNNIGWAAYFVFLKGLGFVSHQERCNGSPIRGVLAQ